jgi:putative oxidoreductase
MNGLRDLALLVGRILMSGLFIYDATIMVQSWDQTAAYMTEFGVPAFLLPLAALFQFGGGILLVLGYWTRWTALGFTGFCLITAFVFHLASDNVIQFGKDLGLAGGFLVLAASGAGRWSADAYRNGRPG